jgi:hypothetical protein
LLGRIQIHGFSIAATACTQNKAEAAVKCGRFKHEIALVTIKLVKGDMVVCNIRAGHRTALR